MSCCMKHGIFSLHKISMYKTPPRITATHGGQNEYEMNLRKNDYPILDAKLYHISINGNFWKQNLHILPQNNTKLARKEYIICLNVQASVHFCTQKVV